jgi:hypothetical protein
VERRGAAVLPQLFVLPVVERLVLPVVERFFGPVGMSAMVHAAELGGRSEGREGENREIRLRLSASPDNVGKSGNPECGVAGRLRRSDPGGAGVEG